MLLPKEKPYLANLNSFYIYLDKFLEQMQQEIGSGCFHCSSGDLEFMIYFNQYELVRVVRLEKDKRPEHLKSLSPVMAAFRQRTFMVSRVILPKKSGCIPAWTIFSISRLKTDTVPTEKRSLFQPDKDHN